MIKLNKLISNIAIIGCGGVTSWMISPLVKLLAGADHQPNLVLVDGDAIEERNLERQWFSGDDIGGYKAVALASKISDSYPVEAIEQYFTDGMPIPGGGLTLFLGCADNHAARRAILSTVDRAGGWAIIAGNEYTEAEAYFYEPRMKDGPADPRVYYPTILTDNTGDPNLPPGCTGLAAITAPQLVLANFSAANHMLWLLYHHFVERPEIKGYDTSFMPVKTWNFGTRFTTTQMKDLTAKE